MTSQTTENPVKLLLSAQEAAAILGIGRAHFYGLLSAGLIGPLPIKLGRRSLWKADEIRSWVSRDCPPRSRWLAMKGER